jgi:hypothetical protein
MYITQYNESTNHNIKYNQKDKFIFSLYSLYFILKPFYFWKSGLPQIADIIMVLLIIVYIVFNRFKISFYKKDLRFLVVGLFFVLWVILVNLIWALRFQTTDSFIFPTLFYVYNFIVTSLVVTLYGQYKEKIIEVTYKSVLISVFTQIIIFLVNGGFSGDRTIVSFNNPNQLGYYSLMIASFLMHLSYKVKIKMKWFIVGIFSSMILVFASLSKAAIVAYMALLFFFYFTISNNKKFKRKFIIITIFALILIVITYNTTTIVKDNLLLNAVQSRLNKIGKDGDDSLEARGYYRIFDYPEYWLLGAGEGKFDRFNHQKMEFHSTLGNIQVSYGLVGTSLFLYFMLLGLRNDMYRSWYILLSIMVYGLTHNGIRNSMLWILLAFFNTGYQNEFY